MGVIAIEVCLYRAGGATPVPYSDISVVARLIACCIAVTTLTGAHEAALRVDTLGIHLANIFVKALIDVIAEGRRRLIGVDVALATSARVPVVIACGV